MQVGPQCPITLNGVTKQDARPLTLTDLLPGDRVVVQHFAGEQGEQALAIAALRVVPGQGVLRSVDSKLNKLTIAGSNADAAQTIVLPAAERCEVTLNGRRVLGDRLLTLADLQPGDAVTYQRDVQLVSIAAQREFQAGGTITAINYDVRSFVATDRGSERTYLVDPACRITLGGAEAAWTDLRRGDKVQATFDSPDAQSPQVTSLSAERRADSGKWAILVVGATFDDATLAHFPAAADQINRLRAALTSRYAVSPDQIIVLEDSSRVRLEQAFPEAVAKAASADQLLVVFAGRAAVDKSGAPLVAPKDFAAARPDETGVLLAPLLSAVEASPAEEKIVLLDLQAAAPASGAAPTAAGMFRSIQGTRSKPLLKTTNVFATTYAASTDAALVGATTTALAGAGDPNRDNLCELTELHEYFRAAAGGESLIELFLPNTNPPRITDDAKEALRRLAALMGQPKIDPGEARILSLAASKLAPKEPEPKLIAALVLLDAKQQNEAIASLRELLVERPATPLAWEASAWAKFEKRLYAEGLADLTQLLRHLPADAPEETTMRIFPWIGRLRELSALALPADRKPPAAAIAALDAAVTARGAKASELFEQGRGAAREVLADFDRRIAAATEASNINQLKFERWQLRHHASFSCEAAAQEVLTHLED